MRAVPPPFRRSLPRAAVLAAGLLLSPSALPAQEPVDTATVRRIRAEAMERSRVMETAVSLSDLFGPRLAGSRAYRQAAEWSIARLASFGVPGGRLEPWGRRGSGWEVERWSVEMTAPRYLRMEAWPKAWSPATAGTVSGTPVRVSVRTPADFERYRGRLRGAIVLNGDARSVDDRWRAAARRLSERELDSLSRLTDPGSPRTYWEDFDGWEEALKNRTAIASFFRREGVAATLEPSGSPVAVRVASYNAYASPVDSLVPAFVVSRIHYNQFVRLLDRGVPARVELSLAARYTRDDSLGYNVVAEIPGTDPRLRGQVVLLGGHFDTWTAGTGATDNSAGVAVGMEVLRILKALDARPRRTIRLVMWDGEEQEDYFGSMGYVRRHYGDPATMRLLPAHRTVSAYYNLDHGTGRIRGVHTQGVQAAVPIFRRWLEPLRDLGASTVTIANSGSTDVMPFSSVGIPAYNLLQDPIDYDTRTHHTSLDVADYLIEDDLKQAAAVMASLVWHTAQRDERMPRAALPAPRVRP